MGLLSFLSGDTKSTEKILDAGISAGDAIWYTDEEKANDDKQFKALYFKYLERTADESTARSISRRLICVPVVWTFLGLIWVRTGLAVADMSVAVAAVQTSITDLVTPTGLCIGFYVGNHALGAVMDRLNKKNNPK